MIEQAEPRDRTLEIRAERPEDVEAVRAIHLAAFGRASEAKLVDRLRSVASTVSCVAVQAGHIVGHIFFSPVTIGGSCPDPGLVMGLAPLAVLPDCQRQGIGTLLVRQGLADCAHLGCKAVVVLGHPNYYPRFGFIPAREKAIDCTYPVPDEVFMVLELVAGALQHCSGIVQYRPEFADL
jgi:putative acetyltransferase